MEIQSNEYKTTLKPFTPLTFGRGQGYNNPATKTVSRRHVSFLLDEDKVQFQVIGKNPIWKHSKKTGKVEIFRAFSKGVMEEGDMFCVSAENPIWFTFKKADVDVGGVGGSSEQLIGLETLVDIQGDHWDGELDIESVDISNIDPIKEFGLVVMGHEFDSYGKRIQLDATKWDWFIEEPEGEESDDNDGGGGDKRKGKRSGKRKKKGEVGDDEDWTAESEEEKEVLVNSRKVPKPAYSTRSKKHSGKTKVSSKFQPKSSSQKKTRPADEEDEGLEDEDENDETLGGFIVDDVSDAEEDMDDDEDEEEFVEDELED